MKLLGIPKYHIHHLTSNLCILNTHGSIILCNVGKWIDATVPYCVPVYNRMVLIGTKRN